MGHRLKNVLIQCQYCGKDFRPWHSTQKYCSQECYHEDVKRKGPSPIRIANLRKALEKKWTQEERKKMGVRARLMWKQDVYKRKAWYTVTESEARELFERYKKADVRMLRFAKEVHHSHRWLRKLFTEFFPVEYYSLIEKKQTRKSSRYMLGRAFEYRVRDFLRGKKYFVLRSPRSGGPADLVALKKGQILFVQCRSGGYMPKIKIEELISLARSVGAIPVLAYRRKRGRELVLENLETEFPLNY